MALEIQQIMVKNKYNFRPFLFHSFSLSRISLKVSSSPMLKICRSMFPKLEQRVWIPFLNKTMFHPEFENISIQTFFFFIFETKVTTFFFLCLFFVVVL